MPLRGEPGDRPPRARLALLVTVTLASIVAVSQLLELFVNRVLRPDLDEWTWISEGFVIVALFVVAVQWERLRLARTALADLERERLVIQAELAVAATVQRGLLPPIPAPAHGMVWHAVMEPAGLVGGDYYDFFERDDGRTCVVLADVSGKGVPAAVFMSNTRAVLRAAARERATPADILAAVSEMLLRDGQGNLYVTGIVATVDTTLHAITYANAGHPPGIVLSKGGQTRALRAGGPPLGLVPAAAYDEESLVLAPRDLVVFVSDGITEALDASGNEIPAALRDALGRARHGSPAEACLALIDATAGSSGPRGIAKWSDDRTVVAFAYQPDAAPL